MRFLLFISLFIFSLMPISGHAAPSGDNITLNLPQSIIAEAAHAILPLALDAHSKTIHGDITIIDISDVALSDKFLTCHVRLAGKDISLVTEIAGHEIKLKVGSVAINSTIDAVLRFDAEKQLLYIKPVIREMGNTATNGPDIGQAITTLLNGREFPVEIQKIDPLLARAGAKMVTVNMEVADIATRPKNLQLSLRPHISTAPIK